MSSDRNRLLPVLSGLFVAVLVLSNILAVKMVRLGPFLFDGGTLLFPLSYIFGDILTEVYGYRSSRKVIWTGLGSLILMSLSIWLIGILPSDSGWGMQGAFDSILSPMPRIALASALGYFAGEWSNSALLSRMKVLTKGRWLWTRTIGSTLAGQAADTLIFVAVAFAGVYSAGDILAMILSNYLFKCAIEILFTPLTYKAVGLVKSREGADAYDEGVRYNPLPLKD